MKKIHSVNKVMQTIAECSAAHTHSLRFKAIGNIVVGFIPYNELTTPTDCELCKKAF